MPLAQKNTKRQAHRQMSTQFKFSVRHSPRLATSRDPRVPWSESNPELHVYLSRHLEPNVFRVVRIADAPNKSSVVRLETNERYLMPHASIGFAGYCRTINDEGKPCKTTAGFARLELRVLIDALLGAEKGKRIFFKLPLREHVDRDFVKGSVEVSFVAGDAIFFGSSAGIGEPLSAQMPHFSEARRGICERVMNAAIKRSIACFYDRYAPAIPHLAKIHCPEFKTSVSVVPGSAYVWQSPPAKTPESFFLNAKRIVFDRAGASESVFNSVLESAFQSDTVSASEMAMAAALVCDMFTLFTSCKYYLADKINENADPRRYNSFLVKGVEHYKCARYGEDDCEGDGESIYMLIFEEFARLELSDRTLRNAQRLLEFYVPFVPLAAVTLASAGDLAGADDLGGQSILAHIFAMLVPRVCVERMLERSNRGIQSAERYINYDSVPRRAWEQQLELLVLEGTGWLCAGQKPLQSYARDPTSADALRNVYTRQSALEERFPEIREHCSGKIFGDPEALRSDPSTFYKYLVAAYTSYFMRRGFGFSDVAFVHEHSKQYGVRFGELLYSCGSGASPDGQKTDIGMHICVEWSAEEIAIAQDVLRSEEPYPPLLAPKSSDVEPMLERIDQLMARVYKQHMRYPSHSAEQHQAIARARPLSLCRTDCIVYQIRAEEFDERTVQLLTRIMREDDSLSHIDHVVYPVATVPTRDQDEPPLTVVDIRLYFK